MKKLIIFIIFLWIFMFCYIAWGYRAYTLNEVVASVICAEAVGEGHKGLYAVANVVANRSKVWHKTPYEIVTQKNQFYGYTSKNREELYNQGKDYCDYLTRNILELDDITKGAIYFRKTGEKKQKWHWKFCIKIKNHIFYK